MPFGLHNLLFSWIIVGFVDESMNRWNLFRNPKASSWNFVWVYFLFEQISPIFIYKHAATADLITINDSVEMTWMIFIAVLLIGLNLHTNFILVFFFRQFFWPPQNNSIRLAWFVWVFLKFIKRYRMCICFLLCANWMQCTDETDFQIVNIEQYLKSQAIKCMARDAFVNYYFFFFLFSISFNLRSANGIHVVFLGTQSELNCPEKHCVHVQPVLPLPVSNLIPIFALLSFHASCTRDLKYFIQSSKHTHNIYVYRIRIHFWQSGA